MKNRKIHYAWVIFIASAVLAFTVVGLCTNTRPLYLDPVSSGLGITRAQLSTVYLISGILSALCSLFIGVIRKRLSLRQLAIIGTFCLACSNFAYYFSSSLLSCVGAEILFGIGSGCASMTVIALIIRTWFAGRLGTVLGVLYMATGLGSVILAPQVGKLIANYGYQTSYMVSGFIMAAAMAVSIACIRDDPDAMGLQPMFAEEKRQQAAPKAATEGLILKEAVRKPSFYLMCVLGLLIGGGVNAVQGTYGAYIGSDLGFGTVFASGVVSFLYVVNTIAKVPLGMMIDKIGVRRVVNICCLGMIGASISLIFLSKGYPTAYVFAACHGIGNILFTVPAPLIAPAIFGTKDVTTLTGVFMACMFFGSAVGSPLSNLVYDITGSYVPLYLAIVVLFTVAIVINTVCVRPAWNHKT